MYLQLLNLSTILSHRRMASFSIYHPHLQPHGLPRPATTLHEFRRAMPVCFSSFQQRPGAPRVTDWQKNRCRRARHVSVTHTHPTRQHALIHIRTHTDEDILLKTKACQLPFVWVALPIYDCYGFLRDRFEWRSIYTTPQPSHQIALWWQWTTFLAGCLNSLKTKGQRSHIDAP